MIARRGSTIEFTLGTIQNIQSKRIACGSS